jgi:hypothetical protein
MKTLTHPASKWFFLLIIIFYLFYLTAGTIYAQQLAFPGAEGFGRYTVGGRGGRVIEVTNLNDSGPGSLRDAVIASEPRIVIFRISGTIELLSDLTIRNSYITIAGQSAPGGGICIRNYPLVIQADQVIIRYIRVRLGDAARVTGDCISVVSGHNIIIDHCSTSWGVDETISVSVSNTHEDVLGNVTIQWCMITESLNCSVHNEKKCHGYGSLNRGGWGNGYTFHHNLYAHHKGRNPYAGNYNSYTIDTTGLIFDFRNNVVYNWGNYTGHNADLDSVTKMNFVNNYYQGGPNTPHDHYAFWQATTNLYNRAYYSGNMMDGVCPEDQWSLVKFDGYTEEQKAAYELADPVPVPPVHTDDAVTAYQNVLAEAGASLARDCIDERIVEDVINGTGQIINCVQCNDINFPTGAVQEATLNTITIIYAHPEAEGRFANMNITITSGTGAGQRRFITNYVAATNVATVSPDWNVIPDATSSYAIIVDCSKNAGACIYPPLPTTTMPPDSDHDGMPDYWEQAFCLNPNDPNDASADRDGDGYTNIEEYLNWLTTGQPMPAHLDSDHDGKGDNCDPCPFDPIDGCLTGWNVLFVDASAIGVNNGSSWINAFHSLQEALAVIHAGQNIAVAEGIYTPADSNRTAAFHLINGVGLYGGYPSGGGPWASRNPKIHQTILSGDLFRNDTVIDFNNPYDLITNPSRAENSYHVVIGSNTDANTILDGFIITAGNANSGGWPDDYGGGMFNTNANCTVNNCTFVANCGGRSGGALFNSQSNLHISNCTFFRNTGGDGGGGILFYDSNNPAVVNCRFISNSGFLPGNNGGGLYNMQNSNPLVMNCIFINNSALYGGAVSNIHGSSPVITNCDFVYNFADISCGGINDYNNSNSTITNCILWDNIPGQISDFLNCKATVSYSDIQGGWFGTGNINANPSFVDADGTDNIFGTEDDNLRLLPFSPCIDVGNNSALPGGVVTDLDGFPRFRDGNCDSNSIVDMGAYEFSFAFIGDFDNQCDVDFQDFAIFAAAWRAEEGQTHYNPIYDISTPANGKIDMLDLEVFAQNWLWQAGI